MCFVWISEQTAIISLYSINLPVFLTEAECLLRGTDWVFKPDRQSFVLKGLSVLQKHLPACLEHDLNTINYVPHYILKVRTVVFRYCYESSHI